MIVTAGPTYEPIDPVRFIGNRSSGRQGHAIAQAAVGAGARVTLVTGPVALAGSGGRDGHSGRVGARNAGGGRGGAARRRLHRRGGGRRLASRDGRKTRRSRRAQAASRLSAWSKTPIYLRRSRRRPRPRPAVVIGFAAETENVIGQCEGQTTPQGLRLIVANSVAEGTTAFGGESNEVQLIGRRRRRGLAADEQGGGRRAELSPAWRSNWRSAYDFSCLQRLPHAEGLQLPAYQSEDAAGMDLVAALPADGEVVLAPGERALIPTGLAIELPRDLKRRSVPARGWRCRMG